MIHPAFTLPILGASSKEFWASYDGLSDGVFTAIVGAPGPSAFSNPFDRSVGCLLGGNEAMLFEVSSLIIPAALGGAVATPNDGLGGNSTVLPKGGFTSTFDRIWVYTISILGSGNNAGNLFAYDGTGLTGVQGPTDIQSGGASENVNTEIDASRALHSAAGTGGLFVGILQRSSGTLIATVNEVFLGTTSGSIVYGMARPLNSTRSLSVHLSDVTGSAPFTLVAQGVAHAGTTPSTDGSPSTIDANVADRPVYLTRCLDGLSPSEGRFLAAWIDETNGDVQLAIVHYDGTTITVGSTLDTGFTPSGEYEVEDLGGGNAVILSQDDADGWLMVHYAPSDVNDLDLELSTGGTQSIVLDGAASGDAIQELSLFALSENRFGISARNTTDGQVQIKVIHNGLGS